MKPEHIDRAESLLRERESCAAFLSPPKGAVLEILASWSNADGRGFSGHAYLTGVESLLSHANECATAHLDAVEAELRELGVEIPAREAAAQ